MKSDTKGVPSFEIGQTKGVIEYALSQMGQLAERLGLKPAEMTRMIQLFTASLMACAKVMPSYMNAAFAPAIPEARLLFDWLGETLLGSASQLIGEENMVRALELQRQGFNILLVSNHTSGADHPAMEHLINSRFGVGTTSGWTYMSGHVVNIYLIPLALSGGINRIQIFSSKYCSLASQCGDGRDAWMRAQNQAAMRFLGEHTLDGGQLVVLYPEGGRGEGALLRGEPKTMVIPRTMAKCPRGLFVLPCYVDGATSLLPVERSDGELEFTRVLHLMQRGNATVRFGEPVPWQELQPTSAELLDSLEGQERSIALHHHLIGRTMRLIADLAPSETAKGPYASL